jgi:hypothetical protein
MALLYAFPCISIYKIRETGHRYPEQRRRAIKALCGFRVAKVLMLIKRIRRTGHGYPGQQKRAGKTLCSFCMTKVLALIKKITWQKRAIEALCFCVTKALMSINQIGWTGHCYPYSTLDLASLHLPRKRAWQGRPESRCWGNRQQRSHSSSFKTKTQF